MTIYLIAATKYDNSTATPDYTNSSIATSIDGTCRSPCDILSPVFEISQGSMTNLPGITAYNYMYIPDFLNRYYKITKWVFDGPLCIAYCKVDVLASWRSQILSSYQYVLRAYSNYDGTIKDTKYPIKASNPLVTGYQTENPLQPASGAYGMFVVGVVAKGASLGIDYYCMSYLVFLNFTQQLFTLTTQWGSGGTDLADGLKKSITDPFQYIVSVEWFPYSVTDVTTRFAAVTGSYYVTVGYDTITLSAQCYPLGAILNFEFTNLIGIPLQSANGVPAHPYAASRGDYMNQSPFTRYYMTFWPFCGLAELDSTRLGSAGYLYLVYTVDLRTGRGVLNVCTDYTGSSYADWKPNKIIRTFEAQIGVSIPVAAIHTALPSSVGQVVTNAIVSAGSEFGGFAQIFKKGYATILTGFYNALHGENFDKPLEQYYDEIGATPFNGSDVSKVATSSAAMQSTAEIIGSQGTFSTNSRMPLQVFGVYYYPVADQLARFGRPLCQNVQLSTLSGFVLCDTPSIRIYRALKPEEQEIENYLKTGVFIE